MPIPHEAPSAPGNRDYYDAQAMYGIRRLPNNWRVTLSRGGQRFLREFAFNRCGGESAALACAQAYRDEIVRNYLPPERSELARKLRTTNKSGVSGVTFRLNAKGEIMRWHAITPVSACAKPGQTVGMNEPSNAVHLLWPRRFMASASGLLLHTIAYP